MDNLKIALAQIDSQSGNVASNTKEIIKAIDDARLEHANIVVFPELCVCGYTARDLWFRESFLNQCAEAVLEIAAHCAGIVAVLGSVIEEKGERYNVAIAVFDGQIIATHRKMTLPSSELFEERRYFSNGREHTTFRFGKYKIGLQVCEDLWGNEENSSPYSQCDLILCPSALPWTQYSQHERDQVLHSAAIEHNATIVFVNALSYENNLILDGASCVYNYEGDKVCQLANFKKSITIFDYSNIDNMRPINDLFFGTGLETLFNALSFSITGYVSKAKKNGAIISLTPDLNSFLTLFLAVHALGPDKVDAFIVTDEKTPIFFEEAAKRVVQGLGCRIDYISVANVAKKFKGIIEPVRADAGPLSTLSLDNLPMQLNGFLLGSLALESNSALLSSVNKTELALTIFDEFIVSKSAIAPISDLYQTEVLKLLEYRNVIMPLLSTVEIKLLSDYYLNKIKVNYPIIECEQLDEILKRYIEGDQSPTRIINTGFKERDVLEIAYSIDNNESKRLQFPICPKVSRRTLTDDWRMPILQQLIPAL